MRRLKRLIAAVVATLIVGGILITAAPPASAGTYPGAPGPIYFTRGGGGGSSIWRMNPDGSGLKQMVPPSGVGVGLGPDSPAISPNGKRLAFSAIQGTASGGARVLWEMDVDVPGSYRLLNFGNTSFPELFGDMPTWSPDSSEVIYSRTRLDGGIQTAELFKASRSGVLRLTANRAGFWDVNPEWSPDGRLIAFGRCKCVRFEHNPYTLHMIRAGERFLGEVAPPVLDSSPLDAVQAPSWRPDSSRVVYSTHDGLGVTTFDPNGNKIGSYWVFGSKAGDAYPTYAPQGVHMGFGFDPTVRGDNIVVSRDGAFWFLQSDRNANTASQRGPVAPGGINTSWASQSLVAPIKPGIITRTVLPIVTAVVGKLTRCPPGQACTTPGPPKPPQ